MLKVTELICIADDELEWSFARAGGPGGQNVNKVSSKAILRWKAATSATILPESAKVRMRSRFPSRFTVEGDVLIQSQRYRDQEGNKVDCAEKLVEMIRISLIEPTPRKASKPSKGAHRRRMADKRHNADRKKARKPSGDD